MSEKNYITPKGHQKLKDEYNQLVKVERPKVVEVVSWAAGNGDRSENADYTYGKKRLREIDRRLRFIQDRLDRAEVVDPKSLQGSKVIFGATITVLDEDENKKVFQIVGEDEIETEQGKISWKSPIAKALLGKKVGDDILVRKPTSEEYLTIEKIEFI